MVAQDAITKKFMEEVDEIEWWKRDGAETLKNQFNELVLHGISPEMASNVIWSVFYTAQEEYGD